MSQDERTDAGRLHPLVRIVATGLYSGYSPVAPGTAGSLVCAVILWFALPETPSPLPPPLVAAALASTVAFVALAVWAAGRAERHYGHDASKIVIDEFAGFALAVFLLPKSLFVFAVAFVIFRAADIVKPFPARRAEALPGGWGIVADDLVAGIYTNLLIRLMFLVRGW